ncbi:MAG: hypothetical protein M3Q81_03960 [bacterium]|nr:hypothetical protein [bacterium]
MQNIRITRTIITVTALALLMMAKPIMAQEQAIFTKPDVTQEINTLRVTYREQLTTYRNDERLFVIAQGQFSNLNTLVSLETAVKATQSVMKSRVQVLKSYLSLLRLQLISTTGIDLDQKQLILSDLDQTLIALDAHAQVINAATDRAAVNQAADEFATLKPIIDTLSAEGQLLLSLGRMQAVYDNSVALKDDLKVEIATSGGVFQQAERQRAFTQTEATIETVRTELRTIIDDSKEDRDKIQGLTSNTVNRQLLPIHDGLSQIVAFLAELMTL